MFLLSSVGRAGGSDYKGKNIDKKVSDFGSETVYSSLAQSVERVEVITKENTDRCFPVCNRKRESSLAQSVERLTVNQDVTGSSPVGGAI